MAFLELVEGYSIDQDYKGITGQRQFIYSVTGGTEPWTSNASVTLPAIGDIMHDSAPISSGTDAYQKLYCIKRTAKYLNGDKSKILWTCMYSNEPIDTSDIPNTYQSPTSPADLPQNIEYSGEFQLFKPPVGYQSGNTWKWDGGTTAIAQAIPFRVRTYNKKIGRIIPDSKFNAFVTKIQEKVGMVNKEATTAANLGDGGGQGCWLFTGASCELFRNHKDARAYKFDLNFIYRDPDNLNSDGWQKILNEIGEWKLPKQSTTNKYLYETTSFTELFT